MVEVPDEKVGRLRSARLFEPIEEPKKTRRRKASDEADTPADDE